MKTARDSYLERLADRSAAIGTVLCLGVDPDPAELPDGYPADVRGIESFARTLVEAGGPCAAAIKLNLAFFEAYGSAGVAALERVRAAVPEGLPVILDAKRADIGSTAARQAVALLEGLGADAVTLNPYLGLDALEPFLQRLEGFAYLVCRTSNPGAGVVQDVIVAAERERRWPSERLYQRVARLAGSWASPARIGLVVGATAPRELAEIRQAAPDLAFLVAGIGAQGGSLEAVLSAAPARAAPTGGRPGRGLLVNVSRAISRSSMEPGVARYGGGLEQRLADAARDWAARLPVLS